MSEKDPGGTVPLKKPHRAPKASFRRLWTLLMSILGWVREEKKKARTKDSLLRKIYIEVEIPLGILCLVIGGMQNQLYAWSHDFAVKDYVGVPIGVSREGEIGWKEFWGFSGAEWEYFNIFFAQGSAVVLAILGGYFIGSSLRRMRNRKSIWKNMVRKEREVNRQLLEFIKKSHIRRETKTAIMLSADPHLTTLEKTLLEEEEELEQKAEENFREQYPRLAKLQKFLDRKIALPASIAAHSAVLFSVHYTWVKRYYEGEEYVGPLHESVFWNWVWFVGAYTTYSLIALSSYNLFYDKGNSRVKKKIRRLKKKSGKLQKKRPEIIAKLRMLEEEEEGIERKMSFDIDLYGDGVEGDEDED